MHVPNIIFLNIDIVLFFLDFFSSADIEVLSTNILTSFGCLYCMPFLFHSYAHVTSVQPWPFRVPDLCSSLQFASTISELPDDILVTFYRNFADK